MHDEDEPADDYIDENIIPIVLALVVAAAVPATIMAVWSASDLGAAITIWVISFLIALVPAFGLGLPGFLALQRRGHTQWWVSLIGGFVVGAVPGALYYWHSGKSLAGFCLFGGGLGMSGGFAAWLVWLLAMRAKAITEVLYCPKCGDDLAKINGFWTCRRGNTSLSVRLSEGFLDKYVRKIRADKPSKYTVSSIWFCPGCGGRLAGKDGVLSACQKCGKSLNEFLYELVLVYPHKDADGKWS